MAIVRAPFLVDFGQNIEWPYQCRVCSGYTMPLLCIKYTRTEMLEHIARRGPAIQIWPNPTFKEHADLVREYDSLVNTTTHSFIK